MIRNHNDLTRSIAEHAPNLLTDNPDVTYEQGGITFTATNQADMLSYEAALRPVFAEHPDVITYTVHPSTEPEPSRYRYITAKFLQLKGPVPDWSELQYEARNSPAPAPLPDSAFDIYPNPAAPDDPDTALLASHVPDSAIPEGFEKSTYTYTVIERINP